LLEARIPLSSGSSDWFYLGQVTYDRTLQGEDVGIGVGVDGGGCGGKKVGST
jgi:hypothetical protein